MTRRYKIVLLAALYVAQGLPYGFFTQALPVLLRDAGFSLKAISATSLLFLPWALKFLWAPFVDHRGTRKSWLLPLQVSAVAIAVLLSAIEPGEGFLLVLGAAFVFNAVAACQDVATDGLAVRVLDTRERGLANGLQVGAYRLGMILGGGLLLYIFARSNWSVMFLSMAALLALTVLPVLPLREPPRERTGPPPSFVELAQGWVTRLRVRGMLPFIGLICFYKFGDSMVASMVGPFLRDGGLSKETIAIMKGTVGSVTSLCGAALGGIGLLWAGTVAEHLLGSMATVALFTLMMDASDPEHAGTDYTLLACAIVVAMGLASFTGAAIADAAGYGASFVTGCGVSVVGCLALVRSLDRHRGPERLQPVWVGT